MGKKYIFYIIAGYEEFNWGHVRPCKVGGLPRPQSAFLSLIWK